MRGILSNVWTAIGWKVPSDLIVLCANAVLGINNGQTCLVEEIVLQISSLVRMKEENRHHFRFRSKEVFIKLTRKFG